MTTKPWRATVAILLLAATAAPALGAEKLGRGLIALEQADGSVFLSWRLLESDPPEGRFFVSKVLENGVNLIAPNQPKPGQTFWIDESVRKLAPGKKVTYAVALWIQEAGPQPSPGGGDKVTLTLTGKARPYLSIPLDGDYDFQKVGVGDLDGDGEYEFLIKQPNFNTDPYQKPGYWKKSNTTYKLEAYKLDGALLWRHDMGWSIEAGIWYSPWIVYDLDGDGRAEVYCKAGEGDPRDEKGLVTSGPEWLVKLDGRTGKVVKKMDWLTRDGFTQYNYYQRNFLTVAYLDGVNPSLIMQRGTYKLIKMLALDKNFKRVWQWSTEQEQKRYGGQSGHGLITADVDGDGRDELVMGASVIDDNGKGLWTMEMGHPDVFYVADIDADNPGLEIFYGLETRQQTDGLCVVDAKTGRKLWAHKQPTRHLHGQGMAADVLAEHPGVEILSGERDTEDRWFYTAKGKLIKNIQGGTLTPRGVWWDADPQKEVVIGDKIMDWEGKTHQRVEGRVIAVMDCLGDYREEIVTTLKGELRIYSTTLPADAGRVCLMQDRQYRLGVCAQTMGYYYPAQLGN